MDSWIDVSPEGMASLWMQNRPNGVILFDGDYEVFVSDAQLGKINGMVARERNKGGEHVDDPGAA